MSYHVSETNPIPFRTSLNLSQWIHPSLAGIISRGFPLIRIDSDMVYHVANGKIHMKEVIETYAPDDITKPIFTNDFFRVM